MELIAQARRKFSSNSNQATNGMYVIGGVLSQSGLGFIFWLLAAHLMSATDVGITTATISVVSMISIIGSVGVGYFLIRHLPKLDDHTWSAIVVRIGLILFAISTIVSPIIGMILTSKNGSYSRLLGPSYGLVAFSLFVIAQTLIVELDAITVAEQKAWLFFIRSLTFGILKIISISLIALLWRLTPILTVASTAISLVVSAIFPLAWLKLRVRPGLSFTLRGSHFKIMDALRELFSHWIIQVGAQLPAYLLPVVVLARDGAVANAHFYVGWSIGSVLFIIASSASQTLIAEAGSSKDSIARLLVRNLKFVFSLQFPAIVAMILIGPYIARLFGAGYVQGSTTVLRVVAIAALVDGLTTVTVNIARLLDNLPRAVSINITMAVTTLISAWLLVPSMGPAGAGLAYAIGNAFGAAIFLFWLPGWRRSGVFYLPAPRSRYDQQSFEAAGA